MNEGLQKFLFGWTEELLRTAPLSRRGPALGAVLERQKSIDRTLGKVHPDLADGEVACVLIYEILARELGDRYSSEALDACEGRPLNAEPEVVRAICQALIEYLDSIPRQTLTLAPIGSIESIRSGYFDLGQGFCIVSTPIDDDCLNEIPQNLRPLFSDKGSTSPLLSVPPIAAGTYLGRVYPGIPTVLAGRETFNRSFDDLKVWIGIGRRLFHFSEQAQAGLLSMLGSHNNKYAYLIDITSGVRATMTLSPDESAYLSRLSLKMKDGDLKAYSSALREVLAPFFEGQDLRPAAAAYQWLIDSRMATNSTNSFLCCCFGLEASLGDDASEESITTLLAERCAYLLGETNSQRSEIKATFKRIYRIRSKLVHGRERRVPGLIGRSLIETQSLLENVAFAEWSKVIKKNMLAKRASTWGRGN